MTYCNKLFESLDKRLDAKKTLDAIGKELCSDVKEPREKAIRLIKAHKGDEWLIENAQWLKYDYTHIRNPTGKKGKRAVKPTKMERNYKDFQTEESVSYEQGTQVLAGKLQCVQELQETIEKEIDKKCFERMQEILKQKEKEIRESLTNKGFGDGIRID